MLKACFLWVVYECQFLLLLASSICCNITESLNSHMKFWKELGRKPSPKEMCVDVCQQFTFRSVLSLRQKLRCTWRLVKSCFGVLAVHRVFGRCGCSTQVRQFCLGWDTELGLAAQRTQSGSSPISHLGVHAAQLCLVCCSSTVGHFSLRVLCLEHWCASLMAEIVTSYVLQHILFENIYLIITTL